MSLSDYINAYSGDRIYLSSRLCWLFTRNFLLQTAEAMIEDLDLYILPFFKFGKGAAKKGNLSPDAFIQLSLQLTYFRNAGQFCQTYEACMTRLFRDGRTETVRPCTNEAATWVRAMDDPNVDVSSITDLGGCQDILRAIEAKLFQSVEIDKG